MVAQPFLAGSTWFCYPDGWASYGPYGSTVSIAGTGAHIIDAAGYDRLYDGTSDWHNWPVGAFFQVPPCGGGGGGGGGPTPALPLGPSPTAAGLGAGGRGCQGGRGAPLGAGP